MVLATIIHTTKGTLSKVYARPFAPRMRSGRPSLLTVEELEFVEKVIHTGFDRRGPVTYSDIMIEL
jgi:hypothetical protein